MGLVIQSLNIDKNSNKSNLIEMKSDEKSAKNTASVAGNGLTRRQANQTTNNKSNTPLLDNITDHIESDHE